MGNFSCCQEVVIAAVKETYNQRVFYLRLIHADTRASSSLKPISVDVFQDSQDSTYNLEGYFERI